MPAAALLCLADRQLQPHPHSYGPSVASARASVLFPYLFCTAMCTRLPTYCLRHHRAVACRWSRLSAVRTPCSPSFACTVLLRSS